MLCTTHLPSALVQEAQQLCKRLGDSQAMAKTLVLLAEASGKNRENTSVDWETTMKNRSFHKGFNHETGALTINRY